MRKKLLERKSSITKPTAYVLINTEPAHEAEILHALQKMEEVKEVYTVYGKFDIIAKVEYDSMDILRHLVFEKIRSLPVNSTETAIVAVSPTKYPATSYG